MLSDNGAPVEVPVASVTPVIPVSVGVAQLPAPFKNVELVPPVGT